LLQHHQLDEEEEEEEEDLMVSCIPVCILDEDLQFPNPP
jgi:hypothetical protein